MTSEVSAWLEHELMPGFAVAGGYVYRKIENFRVLVNQNRPMSAYNVPITIRDPGPDGVLGNGDDGPGIPGFNLSAAALASPVRNVFTNLPGDAEFHTLEFSANKRQSGAGRSRARSQSAGTRTSETGISATTSAPSTRRRRRTISSTPRTVRYNWSRCGPRRSTAATMRRGASASRRRCACSRVSRSAHLLAGAANGINYGSSASSPSRSTRSGRTTSSFSTSAPRSSSTSRTRAVRRVLRRLQPDQRRRRTEHQLGQRLDLPLPGDDHRADDHAVRREVRLVTSTWSVGEGLRLSPRVLRASDKSRTQL